MKPPRPSRVAALLLLAAVALPLAAQTAGVAAAEPAVVQQTLLQKLNMPTIYILLGCSVAIVWLVLDGWRRTERAQVVEPDALEELRTRFRAGDYAGAFAYCAERRGRLTNTIRAGLAHACDGKEATEDAMAVAIVGENAHFQHRIAYLSVIGVIAPMIGLSGTVFGMIDAFSAMGSTADPARLSGAIGKVLYATAGGLVVAIPAFVAYYLLRNRTASAMHALQVAAMDLFRNLPYRDFAGVHFEGGEPVAARPNWITATAGAAE